MLLAAATRLLPALPRRSPAAAPDRAPTRRSRCCAKSRTRPAKPSAEQYEPTSVSTVLGNPSVELTSGSKKAAGKVGQDGADRGRHRRARRRLPPRPARRSARRHLRLRQGLRQADRGRQGAGRPPTPTSPARSGAPGSSSSTGSSGTSTSSTTCTRATGRGCRSPSKRNTAAAGAAPKDRAK